MRIVRIAALAVVALSVGCSNYDRYEIRLTPVAEGMRRELTCWRAAMNDRAKVPILPFPKERLARIAATYGKHPPVETQKKHVFERVFESEMPHDVGGAGAFVRQASPFGTLFLYSERFRGDDDILKALAKRTEAADRLADVIAAWAQQESAGRPQYEPLRAFIDRSLRRDLKNIALMGMLTHPHDPGIQGLDETDLPARIAQYLLERKSAGLAEFPDLAPPTAESRDWAHFALPLVARRLGFDPQSPPEALGFLAPERIAASWLEFARTSALVARIVSERGPRRAMGPEDEELEIPAEPKDLLADLFLRDLLGTDLSHHPDSLSIVLDCAARPFTTNGAWDEAAKRVEWKDTAIATTGALPTLRFAYWAVPDATAQTARFGVEALKEKVLGTYVRWYVALSEAERASWDRQVAVLVPGPGLIDAIASLVLVDAAGRDIAEPARSLLKNALAPPASAQPKDR